ncbi:RPM1-interacting protein 4-like [Olea europaea var. sylvestris]|uniref:RPM1-interacting protein 4-like n=1 Tax=Olea europaea var. sylvestris TaxID=158386 RepID=UPI000C1CEEF5|nr:RPM1-interacting protein 4-like [Olea europaea var. sylvestris]
MARPGVPKFGNWENEEKIPYTVVFTNARKNRGGKMINPNDPLENPDMFPNMDPSPPASAPSKPIRTRPNEPIARVADRPTPDHRVSREDFDFRQSNNPPARSENMVQKSANESTHRNYGDRGARSNGPARQSAGSEYSIERSPLHPHYQAKVSGRGNSSFSSEGKNSYDSSHGTPGRSRLRPVTKGDETPDKSAAVPKFGIWNDDDPQSAENFTQLFDDARKGRNVGPGNSSGTPKHTSHNTPMHQHNNNQKKCCFPWF